MKKKLFIKISFLCFFVLFILGNVDINENNYYKILGPNMSFQEVGVKQVSTYKCNPQIIVNNLKNKSKIKSINYNENNITIIGEKNTINYEAIIGVNETKEMSIVSEKNTNKKEVTIIKKQLEELTNDTCENRRYFTYIKGKLGVSKDTELDTLETNLINIGATNIKSIPINSGYVGVATINSFNLNYAICNYNSGTYIILGTPDIFATY